MPDTDEGKKSMDTINLERIEEQIIAEQKNVKYDIREFTLEYYYDKYHKGLEKEDNELYVPEYQREFIWDEKRQSQFIESLILGLPVPLMFVAENESDGKLEIVDGSQRIRTIDAFMSNELKLKGLKKLPLLNGLTYNKLSNARQRMFKNISMRMIILGTATTSEIRQDVFERINTSAVSLLPMEIRRGVYRGKFTDLIIELASEPRFKKLCPQNKMMENRREEEEMVLRLFAFTDTFPSFKYKSYDLSNMGVADFLDRYIEDKNSNITDVEIKEKRQLFDQMVSFVEKHFPNQGFAKGANVIGVSKPYFEAIGIGAVLALKKDHNLINKTLDLSWTKIDKKHPNELSRLVADRYRTHTTSKLRERIEYAKQQYLK